uniref:hypothetical protein n=1 Tax=Thermoanaerobacter sp. A7A TaxID=1350366 RepID=UPI0005B4263C
MAIGDKYYMVRLDRMIDEITQRDGSGSQIDADLLDGKDSSYFAPAIHNHDGDYLRLTGGTISGDLTITGDLTVNGTINGESSGSGGTGTPGDRGVFGGGYNGSS